MHLNWSEQWGHVQKTWFVMEMHLRSRGTLHLTLGGQLGRPLPPSVSPSSQYRIDVRAEQERHTRKLGHQASSKTRGSVIVLCHTCRDQYYSINIEAK